MIKGTTANCKIKSITVSDSTAYITCILYSLSPAKIHEAFKFYLRDKNKTITAISQNIYWIDRINNYNNDILNIDVNQYLEVLLQVDISNQNTADVINNKWVRNCNLILKNINDHSTDFAWISEDLTLISKEFEIPTIKDLDIYSDRDYNLHIKFKYQYKSQQDFNYNNQNLYTTINIVSIHTHNILETLSIEEEETFTSRINATMLGKYNTPINIQIQLKNSKGEVLSTIERLYKPIVRTTTTYIKTEYGIKRALAFYVRAQDILTEE